MKFIVKRELEIQQYNALPLNQKLDYRITAKSLKDNLAFTIKSENLYNDKEEALRIIEDLKTLNTAICYEIKTRESKQAPKAPFRTSQLQEEANKAYKFTSESTMQYAQKLFEKGLITYHRTDSNSLSNEFLEEVKSKFSQEEWYQRREYKAGKQSQAEAHEAIRITHAHTLEEMQAISNENNLSNEEIKLYTLIYQNSIASQAKDCIKEIKDYIFNIKGILFKFTNSKIIYKGFKGVFEDNIDTEETREDENSLRIDFSQNENINLIDYSFIEVKKNQPKRYKESNFISLLEKEGIGRPSTYASFLKTLLEKECVVLDTKGEITPTQKALIL
ncbi:DNA topoisomerase [Helicobacter sp.]|uniref:DNA topoisomerase n=1 Tax=Helicobacter sp. TaxID=218 RepID=UPI00345A9142